jgi:hypothetical protein
MDRIIRLKLTDEQRAALAPILDACRAANGYEGVLCTLARSYSMIKSGSVLQLQVVRVPRSKAAKVMQVLGTGSKTAPPI